MEDKKKTQLQDLPIELFDEIFKHIHPNDLAAISLTCREFKNLAESYFDRKYKNKNRGIVRVISDGKVRFDVKSSENFEIYFRAFIPNLHVILSRNDSLLNTFQLIKPFCVNELYYIHLQFQDVSIINSSFFI